MSEAPPPILCEYNGDGWVPVGPTWQRRASEHYTVHDRMMMVPFEERTKASHDHFFAAVEDAWGNLPEALVERFPSATHLRKYALVRTGFCDEKTIVCASNAEATHLAAYIRGLDGYAVISLQGNVVTSWTAHSQKKRLMGKDKFQESKTKVLDYIASLIGTTGESLESNAGQAA